MMYYKLDSNGNAEIYDGSEIVTKIHTSGKYYYPVGCETSTCYEHPEGITLSVADAAALGIPEEHLLGRAERDLAELRGKHGDPEIADALRDGEYLANAGYTDADQALIELMYDIVTQRRG